jgi:hypothetical protein
MFFKSFCIALLFFSTLEAGDNSATSRVLVPSSSHLLEVPSFGYYGNAQCDKDGNLFFHSNSTIFNQAAVLKLSAGSWEPTIFKISADFLDNTAFEQFSVSPSGTLWLLGESKDHYIYTFSSDGQMTGRTRLEVPDHLNLQDFAVSDRGTSLVAGFFDSKADAPVRGTTYVALLDHSGRLLHRFNEPYEAVDLSTVGKAIQGGNAVFGDDGFIYLLHSASVLVVSESGAVVRRIKFDKPDHTAIPTRIAVSNGMAAIWLSKVGSDDRITQQFLLLNAETGEPFAIYTPSEEISHWGALCFSRKEGFEFYAVESGRVKLINAALR